MSGAGRQLRESGASVQLVALLQLVYGLFTYIYIVYVCIYGLSSTIVYIYSILIMYTSLQYARRSVCVLAQVSISTWARSTPIDPPLVVRAQKTRQFSMNKHWFVINPESRSRAKG